MHPQFRPILGIGIDKVEEIRFPVWATPKFDGIRVLTSDEGIFDPDCKCMPICRSLKPVPNSPIRKLLGQLPAGFDGEIVTYSGGKADTFQSVQSQVMSDRDEPIANFKYHAFDRFDPEDHTFFRCIMTSYEKRIESLEVYKNAHPWLKVVYPTICANELQLDDFERKCLEEGYEGICYRLPSSPYKFGRSTGREQCLVKVKRFTTAEGEIVGCEEERHNENAAKTNELGYKSRSSHKAKMVGKGRLGAFRVRPLIGQHEFQVGTGFTADDREKFWLIRNALIGKLIVYKYQKHGTMDRPRIPVFIGFRSALDMTAEAVRGKPIEQYELPLTNEAK